ncbi:MAG: hypothetical protein L6437_04550, partial [Kiritimatiellae bacterium]|nr:hypothetical protein [Kiritimatiellia bacterium]
MNKQEYGMQESGIALPLFVSLMLFLCAETFGAGWLQPPPMEVELDQAEYVVVGQITSIKAPAFDPAGGLQCGTATIAVTKMLKGLEKKQIETLVVVGVGSNYVGFGDPDIRRIGDSGVWILGNDLSIFGTFVASELKVEQALDFLAKRTWTAQTNGLEARAGVFYTQYELNPRPWLLFAIRNVSDHDISDQFGTVRVTAVAENGQTLTLKLNADRGSRYSYEKLSPGNTKYVCNGFFEFYFMDAISGKYKVTLTYEQVRDIRIRPSRNNIWKGTLTPFPIEVSNP